ncbi:Origin recognition complex, subunit 2 [Dillenia turbinata]|uniref:Origin recognition complex subunit 2 n=1 Tax=Dillenia turbinata TaxID=194707 RepID=A0AAN8UBP8_9MAGN
MVKTAKALLDFAVGSIKTKMKTPRNLPKFQQYSSRSVYELLTFLDESHGEGDDCFVCVIIHNIYGPGLWDSETQQYLEHLASCSNIHIIASIDHINAPL